MKHKLHLATAFLAGVGLTLAVVVITEPGQAHAREETKQAFMNRRLAIERGDRAMQTYFEEVIAWNAHMNLSPRFFGGSHTIDWLAVEVEEPPYRRIKDGTSYAELRKLMRGDG